MDTVAQAQPTTGDYYGVLYKGSLVLPLLVILVLAFAFWLFLKKRQSSR